MVLVHGNLATNDLKIESVKLGRHSRRSDAAGEPIDCRRTGHCKIEGSGPVPLPFKKRPLLWNSPKQMEVIEQLNFPPHPLEAGLSPAVPLSNHRSAHQPGPGIGCDVEVEGSVNAGSGAVLTNHGIRTTLGSPPVPVRTSK